MHKIKLHLVEKIITESRTTLQGVVITTVSRYRADGASEKELDRALRKLNGILADVQRTPT